MFVHKLKVTVAIAALMSASALFAHDAKLHAGDATEGQIVSIAGNNVVMKTAKGDVKVTLNKDTKYEMGDQAVDVNHFKKGNKIAVIGTKLATGEIVAKEMIMPMASTKGAAKAEGDHKH
jgi:hypothetical protein